MRWFSTFSARISQPYCLDTASAISSMSMESRPSSSPYSGVAGVKSTTPTSRRSALTINAATSRSWSLNVAGPSTVTAVNLSFEMRSRGGDASAARGRAARHTRCSSRRIALLRFSTQAL